MSSNCFFWFYLLDFFLSQKLYLKCSISIILHLVPHEGNRVIGILLDPQIYYFYYSPSNRDLVNRDGGSYITPCACPPSSLGLQKICIIFLLRRHNVCVLSVSVSSFL